MTIKLFYDLMSQPSRACYMFLKSNNVSFVPCPVALRKYEHLSEKFAAINSFQQVPAIDDGGFKLTESSAILKYLAMTTKCSTLWYPPNSPAKQARIDEYLHWHHWNIRWNGSMIFVTGFIRPARTGAAIDKKKLELFQNQLSESTNRFEKCFIGDTPFISSQDITIADLQAITEFMQPYAIGFDIFADRPVLKAWRDRVIPVLQPSFDESHKILFKVAKRFNNSIKNNNANK